MRYTVRKSVVYVVGRIWIPAGAVCGQEIVLDSYALENAADENRKHTRESLQNWLDCNAGDFSEIVDFSASLEVGDDTIEIPWATENGEFMYLDATCKEVV